MSAENLHKISIEINSMEDSLNNIDLTNPNDTVTYILSAESEIDLGEKCNKVKEANGGDYPDFWHFCIIEYGIMDRVYQNFK